MEGAERRRTLMEILCRDRHGTIGCLARELGVSERTVRRDIERLSMKEPIYTQAGRYGGGVYVIDGYFMPKQALSQRELCVLKKIYGIL